MVGPASLSRQLKRTKNVSAIIMAKVWLESGDQLDDEATVAAISRVI